MNILSLHSRIYEATDGRLGHRLVVQPCLLLRTTGRKSGQTRAVTLAYARDDGSYLVVASNHGYERPPAWLLNLQHKPEAEVQVARKRQPVTASVVLPGDPEYPRLWKAVNDNNKGRYYRYESKTSRPIPVVVLTPAG